MAPDTSAITARQLGLITRAQALAAGLNDEAIRHRLRRGDWARARTGLYVVRGTAASWEQEVLGAVLVAGAQAWASHATAARLWGFRGFDRSALEVTVPLEQRIRVPGVRAHRSGTLDDEDVAGAAGESVGIPALSAARTIVDLSPRFDDHALGVMVDDGLRRRVLSLSSLHRLAKRLPTIAPGRSPQRIERVLSDRTAGHHPGDSELERWVFEVLVEAGLPAPERQHRVVVATNVYYLDLAYPRRLIAIEVDGFDFHRGRTTFDHDRTRQNDLVRAGWTVLRFTSRSSPEEIIATVRALLFGQ